MSAHIAPLAPKLAPIVARLATPFDGERLACVAALARLLKGAGLDFSDLAATLAKVATAAPEPIHRTGGDDGDLIDIALGSGALTPWEFRFVTSLHLSLTRGRTLTRAQRAKLREIIGQRCGG